MSARQAGPYDAVARKWLDLAERRKAHLLQLRESGRWKRYYTEAELAEELREVDLASERFRNVIAPEPQISATAA